MGVETVAQNLWIAEGEPVRWFTMPFPTRMTIIRLRSGELFVHSPIRLTSSLATDLESLGPIGHIVSPNKIHHLFMGEWAAAYPEAKLYASPGLAARRKDLDFEMELDETEHTSWSADLEHLLFRGSRFLTEVVFFHRPSKTLILGDLIENFDPKSLSWFHRLLARAGGVLAPRGGTPRDFRSTFTDKLSARRCAEHLLAWRPERVIFSHGLWVQRDAGPFLERAFSWALPNA